MKEVEKFEGIISLCAGVLEGKFGELFKLKIVAILQLLKQCLSKFANISNNQLIMESSFQQLVFSLQGKLIKITLVSNYYFLISGHYVLLLFLLWNFKNGSKRQDEFSQKSTYIKEVIVFCK